MKKYTFLVIAVMNFIYTSTILEAQIDAIMTISADKGYTQEQLNSIIREYGVYSLPELSQVQAAAIINRLQNDINLKKTKFTQPINPKEVNYNNAVTYQQTVNNMTEKDFEPILAEILEVGMSKYFYLVDGNRIRGEIIKIIDQKCHIETTEGVLEIPMKDILEETIVLTKTDDTRYKGALIKEDSEKLVLKSEYGDVTILKKEIEKMERFHGGRLAPQVESRKTFDQGEDELIGVFFDNNAFLLEPNTFFLSAMSIGYGLTDIFMMTTRYGSSFGGDLNLQPKLRVWHKKTSSREQAVSIGLGLHRAYPKRSILSKYSHAFIMNDPSNAETDGETLNKLEWEGEGDCSDFCYNIEDFINPEDDTEFFVEGYIVYSSKRKNPTGRGKVGYSVGLKTSTMLFDIEKDSFINSDGAKLELDKKYSVPYRLYATFEYDLQKRVKFVGSMWVDNSSRAMKFDKAIKDYMGDIGAPLAFDAFGGDESLMDFDFGFMYSVNNNFRIGLHFQQPYIDIHWEFFEF